MVGRPDPTGSMNSSPARLPAAHRTTQYKRRRWEWVSHLCVVVDSATKLNGADTDQLTPRLESKEGGEPAGATGLILKINTKINTGKYNAPAPLTFWPWKAQLLAAWKKRQPQKSRESCILRPKRDKTRKKKAKGEPNRSQQTPPSSFSAFFRPQPNKGISLLPASIPRGFSVHRSSSLHSHRSFHFASLFFLPIPVPSKRIEAHFPIAADSPNNPRLHSPFSHRIIRRPTPSSTQTKYHLITFAIQRACRVRRTI